MKAPKSFCYFLFYVCNQGVWTYKEVDHELKVWMPEGGAVTLTAHKLSHAEKGLGMILTAPCSGGHAAQLASLQEHVNSWTKKTLNGHLPTSHVWMSYVLHQLGPGLQYGLGTLTNDLASAERCLTSQPNTHSSRSSVSTITLHQDGARYIRHLEVLDLLTYPLNKSSVTLIMAHPPLSDANYLYLSTAGQNSSGKLSANMMLVRT
jgi:hypothetical protein